MYWRQFLFLSNCHMQVESGDEKLCSVYVPTNHLYIGDIFLVNSKDIIWPNLYVREGIGWQKHFFFSLLFIMCGVYVSNVYFILIWTLFHRSRDDTLFSSFNYPKHVPDMLFYAIVGLKWTAHANFTRNMCWFYILTSLETCVVILYIVHL